MNERKNGWLEKYRTREKNESGKGSRVLISLLTMEEKKRNKERNKKRRVRGKKETE